MELYTIHLFAGARGGILADLLLGHHPIGAVEESGERRAVEPGVRRIHDGLADWLDETLAGEW